MAKQVKQIRKSTHIDTESASMATIDYDEYFDWNMFEKKFIGPTTAIDIARLLINWAKLPTSLKVVDFFVEHGFHHTDIMRLCKKYKSLEQAYSQAVVIVGSRREKGGLQNDLNSAIVLSSMSMYDQKWKDDAEWKASIRKDNRDEKGTVIVQMMPAQNSELVPMSKRGQSEIDKQEKVIE